MKRLLALILALGLIAVPVTLNAQQKTFKAVCDRSSGIVKIVATEDRSPEMIPLKGGFPFYQVAEKWVKENYPDGKCDPDAEIKKNQAATDAVSRQKGIPDQMPAKQNNKTDLNEFFNTPPGQAPAPVQAQLFKFRNTSLLMGLLFSNLGKVYGTDPPMIPGFSIGLEQLFGSALYGGTGIHMIALTGKIDGSTGINSLYTIRIPLFAGYRKVNGSRYWGVDLGLAANAMLRPVTTESDLGGEIAADRSFNTITRVRTGTEHSAFEFGIDVWLNDLLLTESGFQMTVLSVGYRYSF
ncbi:MAG TPA: hypothetical protein DIS74_07805 [Bacteroidales bacterium]|nr:hypothetical protein [Bacteroidales bacterium]